MQSVPRSKRIRGIALVVVLWTLLLLSLIAAGFLAVTRGEIGVARNAIDNARAEALADAGVHRAVLGLMRPVSRGGWRVDGTVYGWRFDGVEVRFTIADEGGKIDLNAAPDNLLQGLFVSVEMTDDAAAALVDAIVDFRDADDLRRLNGAEDPDYRSAGLPHEAKDAPFETLEELRQVFGMTGALYDRVAPALTVHSRRRTPFRATSPPEVQAALAVMLGATPEEDEEPDGGLEPEESMAAESDSASIRVLREGPSEARSRVRVYTVHAEGRTDGGAVFAREAVVGLVRNPTEPFRFHAWRQDRRRLFEDDGRAEP